MKDTSQQRSDVEMLEEETQPDSLLADYVDVEKPGGNSGGCCTSKAIFK